MASHAHTTVHAAAKGLPVLNRRSLIKGAVAGAAIAVPVAVEASREMSAEEQVDACVAQLKSLLAKMHPNAKIHPHFLSSRPDGSFRFSMQGDVSFSQYSGEGIYEISLDGYPHKVWLLEEHEINRLTGEPLPHVFYWSAFVDDDGELDPQLVRQMYSPKIIRKIEGYAS